MRKQSTARAYWLISQKRPSDMFDRIVNPHMKIKKP